MPTRKRDLLVFELGARRFALPISSVREILPALLPVALPGAPAIVEGVIDLRGRIVPVLDVRARFELPPKPVAYTDHLIAGDAGGRLVALRVDRAIELASVDSSAIETALAAPAAPHVAGVAKLAGGLALIHDLDRFLSQAENEALDRALEEAR